MGNPLRDRRTPQELAASGQLIEIAEKVGDFKELSRIVGADLETLDPDKLPQHWRAVEVVGQLRFGFADAQDRLPALEGEVSVTIDAVCQRCLEPMKLALDVDLRYLFTEAGPDAVEDGFEVWEMDEELLRPLDLVEEVLIMAMPLAALHGSDVACAETESPEETKGTTTRPFADLRSQMDNDN
jgi:uncharacterized protein